MRDIRAWIAADIIRKHTFGQAKAKNPRAYYRVEQVVAALKLDEPISNSPTQKTPCPK